METRQIKCPGCQTMLELPAGGAGMVARCGQCGQRFKLPEPSELSDETILDWLSEEEEAAEEAGRAASRTGAAERAPSPGDTKVLERVPEAIRLVTIGRKGALFEFPAGRLLDTSFRCSMPRRCLRCGSRAQLRAHVVIYAPSLRESLSLEAAHAAGAMVLKDEDVRTLPPEKLLERLPRVPNVPHPADLPMPYYLCRMCGEAGVVSGEINVNRETGRGYCRLLIRNLEISEAFMVAAGGKGTRGHAKLKRAIEITMKNPWEVLPSSIRHRLEQWFAPQEGERFVGYVPDRDHASSEDGIAGLVISNKRLIHRLDRRCREVSVDQPLVLEVLAAGGGKGELRMDAPSWQIKRLALDGDGIRQLRRGLSAAKFKCVWR